MNTHSTLKIIMCTMLLSSNIQLHSMNVFLQGAGSAFKFVAHFLNKGVASLVAQAAPVATDVTSGLACLYARNPEACKIVATVLGACGLMQGTKAFFKRSNRAAKAARTAAQMRNLMFVKNSANETESLADGMQRFYTQRVTPAQLKAELKDQKITIKNAAGAEQETTVHELLQHLASTAVTEEKLQEALQGYVPRATTDGATFVTRKELNNALESAAQASAVQQLREALQGAYADAVRAAREESAIVTREELEARLTAIAQKPDLILSTPITYTDSQGDEKTTSVADLLKVTYGLAVNAGIVAQEKTTKALSELNIGAKKITLTGENGKKQTIALEELLGSMKNRIRGIEPLLNTVGDARTDAEGNPISHSEIIGFLERDVQALRDLLQQGGDDAADQATDDNSDDQDPAAALTASTSASTAALPAASAPVPAGILQRNLLLAQLDAGARDDLTPRPFGDGGPSSAPAALALTASGSSSDNESE